MGWQVALIYVMIATRSIAERTEELAWVLATLYGANQIGRLGQAFAETRRQGLYGSEEPEQR